MDVCIVTPAAIYIYVLYMYSTIAIASKNCSAELTMKSGVYHRHRHPLLLLYLVAMATDVGFNWVLRGNRSG